MLIGAGPEEFLGLATRAAAAGHEFRATMVLGGSGALLWAVELAGPETVGAAYAETRDAGEARGLLRSMTGALLQAGYEVERLLGGGVEVLVAWRPADSDLLDMGGTDG